ncbi:MAG: hypothetical protein WBK52_06815, partial [Bacilli bacterium]
KYLLDENGDETEIEFTAEMKNAITSYFNPLKTELTGNDNTSRTLYEQMKAEDSGINLVNTHYTKEEFVKFLEFRIKSVDSKLKYFGTNEK